MAAALGAVAGLGLLPGEVQWCCTAANCGALLLLMTCLTAAVRLCFPDAQSGEGRGRSELAALGAVAGLGLLPGGAHWCSAVAADDMLD
jgi:hypothetical protein